MSHSDNTVSHSDNEPGLYRWLLCAIKLNHTKHAIMKHTSTLLAALAFTLHAAAQPVLTASSNAPVPGMAYTIAYGTYVAPGNAGAAQTWDLSTLVADSTLNVSLVQPGTTTHGAQFPGATVAEVSQAVTNYYTTSNDAVNFRGSDDGTTVIVDNPMGRYMVFPCTIGTNWSSPHGADFTFDEMDVERRGTFSGEADGYGTLIMPWGTVENVLRVHWNNTLQDSMEAFVMDHTYDSYVYFVEGQWQPVAELVTATIDMGFGTLTNQFARWTSSLTTSAPEAHTTRSALKVYPNPAVDLVHIALPEELNSPQQITITDMTGRVVISRAWHDSGDRTATLSLASLKPGTYHITVTDRSGATTASTLSFE